MFNNNLEKESKILKNQAEKLDTENENVVVVESDLKDNDFNKETFFSIIKKRKKYDKNYKKCLNLSNIKNFDKILQVSKAVSESEKQLILTEYENLKIWVKTLLSIYGSIPNIIKVIDQIIKNQATNPFGASHFSALNTFGQVEKIIDFYDRKNKLLNIYVLIEKLLLGISDEEKRVVDFKFVNKITVDTIAQNLGIDRRSVYRRIDSIIKKLASFALANGWTTTFISNQLENEPWVAEQYNVFKLDYQKQKQRNLKNNIL